MKCPSCGGVELIVSSVGAACIKCAWSCCSQLRQGAKDTVGKPRFSLLPRKGCLAVIEAREYGAKKYGSEENWKGVPQRDWIEATLRHLYAFLDGEDKDPESGLNHLSHAACSALLAASTEES